MLGCGHLLSDTLDLYSDMEKPLHGKWQSEQNSISLLEKFSVAVNSRLLSLQNAHTSQTEENTIVTK